MTAGKVLFVCAENACRSQMAEALYNSMAKKSVAESAGTYPAQSVNPLAVEVMSEVGLDISRNKPSKLRISDIDNYVRVISFGCIARAAFPRPERLEEWLIDDPAGRDLDTFRSVHDDIKCRVKLLVREIEG
jgi:arsenate reductase